MVGTRSNASGGPIFGRGKKRTTQWNHTQETVINSFMILPLRFPILVQCRFRTIEKKYGIKITLKTYSTRCFVSKYRHTRCSYFCHEQTQKRYMMQDLQDASEFWGTPFSFPKNFPHSKHPPSSHCDFGSKMHI